MFSFEIHDGKTWITNNYNTHIAQYLPNKGSQAIRFCQLEEYNKINVFI